MTKKAEAVRDGQGDPVCDRHGMMHDPEGDGSWVCLNARCKASVDYDSEDPDQ